MIWRVTCSCACAGAPRHYPRQIARYKTRHLFHRRLAEIGGALAGRCPEVSTLPPGQTPPSQRRKKRERDGGVWSVGWDGGGAGPARKRPAEQTRESPEKKQQKETERGGWGEEKEKEKREEEPERERRNEKEKKSQKEKSGTESYRETTREPVRGGEGEDSRLGSVG